MSGTASGPLVPDPPPDLLTVRRTALVGLGVCLVALVLAGLALAGVGDGPGVLSAVRVWLVFGGAITLIYSLSRRPEQCSLWLLGAAGGIVSRFALPPHWDSAQMVVTILAVVALVGAGLCALSPQVRYRVLLGGLAFHFFGIFLATTWPEPTPWITQQLGGRIYLPYLSTMYLRNAYHFYSPDPGPASHVFVLITYDTIDPTTGKSQAEWYTLPDRKTQWKDPLGLTYYRRLSVTEQVSQGVPDYTADTAERRAVRERRTKSAAGLWSNYPRIPFAPEDEGSQYRLPRPDIVRYLLPSYAAHLIHAHSTPDRSVKSVKIYRLEHRVLPVNRLAEKFSPHHPTTFRPYFLGEYALAPNGDAELVDTQDPMLYWLCPILQKVPSSTDPQKRDYEDFLSQHAKYEYNWAERTP